MYDGRVKSDFILFVGLVNSLRSFPNIPHLQNKISLLHCIALHCIKKRGRILDVYFNFCGKNQVASLVLTFVY
jgi:hypothetical protein